MIRKLRWIIEEYIQSSKDLSAASLIMELYIIFLYSSSVLGFLIIFVSLYLLIAVPTKLTIISRFAIHGHDVSSAIAQLFLTLGLQPYLILPCISGYGVGFLTRFGVMSTLIQAWLEVALIAISTTFAVLLTINRALAVSVRVSERRKKLILQLFSSQLTLQLACMVFVGFNLKDQGEQARQSCIEKIKVYPKEMDTMNGVNMALSTDVAVVAAVVYILVMTISYMIVISISVTVLVRSIKEQGKSSQSAQFLANQQRITVSVISFMAVELVGIGIPITFLVVCACFGIGTAGVFQCGMISMCLYPAFGSYYVLMSNTEYRNRIHSLLKRARKVSRISRDQTVSITPQ